MPIRQSTESLALRSMPRHGRRRAAFSVQQVAEFGDPAAAPRDVLMRAGRVHGANRQGRVPLLSGTAKCPWLGGMHPWGPMNRRMERRGATAGSQSRE
jgi:hypothetical protein